MKDTFEGYHPIITFAFFGMMFAGVLTMPHPLALTVSLVCALAYAVQQEGRGAVRFALKFCLPMLLLTAIINPAFSHEGVTILTYLPTGNPLTLESILYGLSAGTMLACALLWFRNFNRVNLTELEYGHACLFTNNLKLLDSSGSVNVTTYK